MSKHNSGKGTSSGQRGGHMPTPNIEETMTEEELFEWLQNAVHAGAFDNFSGTAIESPSLKSRNGMKSLSAKTMAGHSSYTSGRCHTGHRHGLSHVLTARAPLHTMGIAERVRFRGTFRGLRWVSRERGFEELSGV
ncbi:hypothetical protein JHK82_047997 [Glycine max]|nr:hypothetical protein JHK82_047997 [Glycine max]